MTASVGASHAIELTVSYDGAQFCGFAPQREGRTVYGVLLAAVRTMDRSVERLRGASRTDAGVHALGQRVIFDPARAIAPRGWALGLNSRLPSDLAIRSVRSVARGLDPRDVSHGKRYRYRVLRDPLRDPTLDRFAWRIDDALDVARVRREAEDLRGTHDFKAFRTSSDAREITTRTMTSVAILDGADAAKPSTGPRFCDPRLLAIEIEGTAFLHNMVRIIAGTLVDVGRGRLEPGAVKRGFETGERASLGMTAPPHGLWLEEVLIDERKLAAASLTNEHNSPEAASWP